MRNKILYVIVVILVATGLFVVLNRGNKTSNIPANGLVAEQSNQIDQSGNSSVVPQLPNITLPFSSAPKDVAWDLFQKYLEFNRKRDLEGVRSTVYKVAPVCDDPKGRLDCEARMGLAYNYGSALKKEDFVNVWNDQYQIILSTDFKIQEDDTAISRKRGIIFFIRNENGDLKLLSFSPSKGAFSTKGDAPKEEIDARIIRWSEDNDNDGIADYSEECLDAQDKNTCTKTDPKKRDTNGNGWWDGVEALMK
jgi:hypothetical protein